jgi:hypothetical protein
LRSGFAQNTNFGGLKEGFIGINRDPGHSPGTFVGFPIPGIEQARKKITPIPIRDGSTEEFGDFVRGDSFTGGHDQEGRKVEGVNSFKLLYGGLDFLARAGRE